MNNSNRLIVKMILSIQMHKNKAQVAVLVKCIFGDSISNKKVKKRQQ